MEGIGEILGGRQDIIEKPNPPEIKVARQMESQQIIL